MADEDLVTATGLALALIAKLVERAEPLPAGEVSRGLNLLAETASPERPQQRAILSAWAQLAGPSASADTH